MYFESRRVTGPVMNFKKSIIAIVVFAVCLLIVLVFPDAREVVRKIAVNMLRAVFR